MSLKRRINDFWREWGYQHGHERVRNEPAVFAIESTNHCNLRCIMCPRGEPALMERALGTMTDGLFEKILDQVRFFTEPCWFHWFGEPLLHPRLFDQIALAKRRGVPNLGISTNGTLLDAGRARALLDSPLDTLMIAIDGTSKEVYERVRVSPTHTFEEVTGNARDFLSLRRRLGRRTPRVVLSIIVMKETEGQLGEFRRAWLEAGADEVLFKDYTTWGDQTADFVELLPTAGGPRRRQREFPCSALWESVVITWNGRVVPCCYDYDAKATMGDLNRQTLAEIWNGEAYRTMRRNERNGCNDSALCAGCTQAPGHAVHPLWPVVPRRLARTLARRK